MTRPSTPTRSLSEQEASPEPDHALGLRKDRRDAAEVRVAQRPIRIGIVRNVEPIKEVRADLGALRSHADDLHE